MKAVAEPECSAEDALYAAIGERVLGARKHLSLTQEDVAREVGLTRTSITNIEHGRQRIQVHTLYALAEALQVRPEDLLPSARSAVRVALDEDMPASLPSTAREWVQRVVQDKGGGRP